jgi:uncharacterized membrane protein
VVEYLQRVSNKIIKFDLYHESNFVPYKKNSNVHPIFMGYEEAEKKSPFSYVIQTLLSKIPKIINIYILVKMFEFEFHLFP